MTAPSPDLRARSAVAPSAPGRLGVPIHPEQARRYLGELHTWVDARRRELDLLDTAILRSAQKAQLTRDMTLSMALWKAVKDRLDLLMVVWDSGRVGMAERERLATLIWGRLDATLDPSLVASAGGSATPSASRSSNVNVSLPEACRLSDAMAAQLRTRLAIDPASDQLTARVRELRAQLERIRDQIKLEPPGMQAAPSAQLADLSTRVDDMAQRVSRGGDIGGLIGPAEIEAARFERDLIVGGVERRAAQQLVVRARALRADLEQRESALQVLVNDCIRQVAPAPKYAVPDVAALGEIPNTKAAIEAYVAKLDQVGRAMQVVQDAYSRAIQQRTDLLDRMAAQRSRANSLGFSEDPDLIAIDNITRDMLDRAPAPVPLATELVEAYEMGVQWLASQNRDRHHR